MNTNEFVQLEESDVLVTKKVRYRTVGDMTCTAAVESEAYTVDDIIAELKQSTISERGATRMDDRISEAAMEDRKKGGYF
jgi:sulfate adenylyltransferase subunit 2